MNTFQQYSIQMFTFMKLPMNIVNWEASQIECTSHSTVPEKIFHNNRQILLSELRMSYKICITNTIFGISRDNLTRIQQQNHLVLRFIRFDCLFI